MSNASYASGIEVAISAIAIDEDVVSISYMMPTDVRDRGKVVQVHQIQVDRRHKQYRDGVSELVEAAEDLLRDMLGDWDEKEPYTPVRDDDDD